MTALRDNHPRAQDLVGQTIGTFNWGTLEAGVIIHTYEGSRFAIHGSRPPGGSPLARLRDVIGDPKLLVGRVLTDAQLVTAEFDLPEDMQPVQPNYYNEHKKHLWTYLMLAAGDARMTIRWLAVLYDDYDEWEKQYMSIEISEQTWNTYADMWPDRQESPRRRGNLLGRT
jgi:hypothetical protein